MAATVDATFRDEIPRAKLLAFVRDLGFDPGETLNVVWESDEVTVTTYHPHPEHGGRYTATAGPNATDGVVTVTTRVKVIG
jgi:hypothetical protein